MCAPGSKAWTRALNYVRCLLMVAAFFAWMARFLVDNIVAYEVAYVVNSEIEYMLTGTIPDYAPSKLHFSQDALDEIDNLQGYVWARCRIYPTWPLSFEMSSVVKYMCCLCGLTAPTPSPEWCL